MFPEHPALDSIARAPASWSTVGATASVVHAFEVAHSLVPKKKSEFCLEGQLLATLAAWYNSHCSRLRKKALLYARHAVLLQLAALLWRELRHLCFESFHAR